MAEYFLRSLLILSLCACVPNAFSPAIAALPYNQVSDLLTANQYDLQTQGLKFLLHEAKESDFFLLGELHGDEEIPRLLTVLWPQMWNEGYRHIAAELSPWAAHRLEFVPTEQNQEVRGLWTKQEASAVHALAGSRDAVLWGCDMEEGQPQFLIRELAALNPADSSMASMGALTEHGYDRKMAPDLLASAERSNASTDSIVNDVSLHQNLLATLRIEVNRLSPETKMIAQNERERLMKNQFLEHYRVHGQTQTGKVLLRFGRNHLHRGYDSRGISTLGNFIAEFAISQGKKAFNVGAFGAGGRAKLLGKSWDADERNDELTFALLADAAKYSATLFDLRPLRAVLHQIPQDKRSALQLNLAYWADSYDALICYKRVTPLNVQDAIPTFPERPLTNQN